MRSPCETANVRGFPHAGGPSRAPGATRVQGQPNGRGQGPAGQSQEQADANRARGGRRSREVAKEWEESTRAKIPKPVREILNNPVGQGYEAFHAFQHRAAPDKGADEMVLGRYPVLAVQNNVGFALEGAAPAAALRAPDNRAFQSAVQRWLAVRRRRRASLRPVTVEYGSSRSRPNSPFPANTRQGSSPAHGSHAPSVMDRPRQLCSRRQPRLSIGLAHAPSRPPPVAPTVLGGLMSRPVSTRPVGSARPRRRSQMLRLVPILVNVIPVLLGAQEPARDFLRRHARPPEAYLLDKFREHDLVLLGESHWVRQHVEFVSALIPQLHRRGVHVLAMEFARRVDQPLIDSLLAADRYDGALAQRIILQGDPHWPFREYVDLLRVAWEVNQSPRSPGRRFRIIGLANAPDWSGIQTAADQTPERRRAALRGESEADYARVVIDSVLGRGQKALVYAGLHHTFTRYEQPIVESGRVVRTETERMGRYLWSYAPDRVFLVILHHPWPGRAGYGSDPVLPAGGAIERIVGELGPRHARIGFDLRGTPAGRLRDSTSVYALGHELFTLDAMADGYLFLGPVSEFRPVTIIPDFINETNLDYARRQSSSVRFRTAAAAEFHQAARAQVAIVSGWSRMRSPATRTTARDPERLRREEK